MSQHHGPARRTAPTPRRRSTTRHQTGRHGRAALTFACVLAAVVMPATSPADAATPNPTPGSAVPTASASAFDPTRLQQLEAALDVSFAKTGVPGVIVGVWIPGYGEWVSARGVADLGTNQPMRRGNQHKIGSVTKEFMGNLALQVIGDGTHGLSLDSTIDRWYPEIPEASKITVRMLLNMSSGVGNSPQAQVDRICADPYATPSPDEVIAANMAHPRAPFAPGEGFDYANVNFYILGRILEQFTGTDLATLIRDRITDPLGLSRSRFAGDGQLAAPFTRGYTWFCPNLAPATDTTDWPGNEEWAGGAMVSTLDDLHTWGNAMGTGALLTPTARAAQINDAMPSGIPGASYGLGVPIIRDINTGCVTMLQHAGAEPGYQSDLYAFPSSGATMAILGNGNGYDLDFQAVVLAIYPLLVDLLVIPPTATCNPPVPSTTTMLAATPATSVTPVTATPRFTG